MLVGREIIIYLAMKYQGDWNQIYRAVKEKEMVDEATVKETIARLTCSAVTIIDEDYPSSLKKIYKPPFVLFYHGHLEWLDREQHCLAVVGSRQPSDYGKAMTRTIVKELIKEKPDLIIVSGLAKGIDGLTHQACLEEKGKTVAVLGSGIDVCYPSEHQSLYQTIKEHHLLLSEYPERVAPNKEHFPWRNRIIAGLTQGVFVVEAKKRSGTLITVGYALYLGKEVYVLPHPANTDNSCNRLIKDGAVLVESAQDILEHLQGKKEPNQEALGEEPSPQKLI